MFKRTKGYFLLTMLVLTGFAGKIHTDTLSGKERRTLFKELKISRVEVTESIAGLSAKQLNFKISKDQVSIKDCIYRLAAIENELWMKANASLQQETAIKKTVLNDEELVLVISSNKPCENKAVKFKSVKEAMKLYKKNRNEMQKFLNTSTENARAHVAQTSFGNFDVYQLLLLNTILSDEYIRQIEKIKAHPNFPK